MVWLSSFIAAMLLSLLSVVVSTADRQGLPRQLTLFQAIAIALVTNSILHTARSPLTQASLGYAQSGPSLLPQSELGLCQDYLTIESGRDSTLFPPYYVWLPAKTRCQERPSHWPRGLTRSQHWVVAGRYTGKAGAFVNDWSRLTDAVAAG